MRGTRAWPPTGLIPWFSKAEGNTYATLLHHPFLFKGKPTQCSRGSNGVRAILQYRLLDLYLTDRKETIAILQKDTHTPLHTCNKGLP